MLGGDGKESAEQQWEAGGGVSGREVGIGFRVGVANRELGTSVGMNSRVGEEFEEGRG